MTSSSASARTPRTQSTPEAGFMLVFMVLLAALLLIALAVAAPIMAKQLQRDKEIESEHRAQQYVRAIRLYYRKFKAYPPSIDALQTTNNIRFLRRQYIDPLTGKADWRIIHVGENKTTVKGFFGQPLGGLNTTGAGGGLGSASGLASGAAGAAGTSTPSTTVSGGSPLSAGFTGATVGGGTNGASSDGPTPIGSSSSTIGGSSTGGPIMGVGTSKTGDSISDPNEQTTYETWEFLYDPKIELMYQKATLFGGAPAGGVNSTPAGSFGSNAATGQPNAQGSSTNGTTNSPLSSTPQ